MRGEEEVDDSLKRFDRSVPVTVESINRQDFNATQSNCEETIKDRVSD